MRSLIIFLIFLFNTVPVFAQDLTIEDMFNPELMKTNAVRMVEWAPDGTHFYFLKTDPETKESSYYSHHVKSGEEILWFADSVLKVEGKEKPIRVDAYSFTPDGKKLLIKANSKRVWRRPSEASYFLFDLKDQKLQPLHKEMERVRHAKVSENMKYAAYVYENNLYLEDLKSGKIERITDDGSESIINGQFDWVYEEEFGQDDGFSWSPDGKKIVFWWFDQSRVKTFTWMDFDSAYGPVNSVHYPKAGEQNSIVKIGVYHLESGKTVWVETGDEDDIYIPRINWTNDADVLMVQRLNRLQNKLELLLVDADTGKSKVIRTETDPCWVDVEDNLFFLKHKDQFTWTSEKDGFRHIYLFDLEGNEVSQLTTGEWEVGTIYGVDEKNGKIFFSANKEQTAEQQIYSVGLDGKKLKILTIQAGNHHPDFAPDYSAFIDRYSSFKVPFQTELRAASGKTIRSLAGNDPRDYDKYNFAYPELLTFTTEDGVELKAMMTKPVNFDPTKKYPVLIYGYSGPGSQTVRNSWGRAMTKIWYTMLTQKGYIIFMLDNRGTGGRGKAFKNLAYEDIGKYAVIDHVQGAKYLSSLPYVDGSRIGIWGWSGGGYLTMMSMCKGSDYFKAGIAVASVSNFRLYDTIWTERYMGLPQTNTAGYDSASALNYTDQYKGGLLIIHGASDDNVHMQNTMQFIDKLTAANKPFDLMIYPGKNHSMRGGKSSVHKHLYTLMTKFILENL